MLKQEKILQSRLAVNFAHCSESGSEREKEKKASGAKFSCDSFVG